MRSFMRLGTVASLSCFCSRPLLAAFGGKKGMPSQSALLSDPNDSSISEMNNDLSQMGATGQAMDSINQFQADLASFQTDLRVRYTLDASRQPALSRRSAWTQEPHLVFRLFSAEPRSGRNPA